jgi:hypothetical protein
VRCSGCVWARPAPPSRRAGAWHCPPAPPPGSASHGAVWRSRLQPSFDHIAGGASSTQPCRLIRDLSRFHSQHYCSSGYTWRVATARSDWYQLSFLFDDIAAEPFFLSAIHCDLKSCCARCMKTICIKTQERLASRCLPPTKRSYGSQGQHWAPITVSEAIPSLVTHVYTQYTLQGDRFQYRF